MTFLGLKDLVQTFRMATCTAKPGASLHVADRLLLRTSHEVDCKLLGPGSIVPLKQIEYGIYADLITIYPPPYSI